MLAGIAVPRHIWWLPNSEGCPYGSMHWSTYGIWYLLEYLHYVYEYDSIPVSKGDERNIASCLKYSLNLLQATCTTLRRTHKFLLWKKFYNKAMGWCCVSNSTLLKNNLVMSQCREYRSTWDYCYSIQGTFYMISLTFVRTSRNKATEYLAFTCRWTGILGVLKI